MTNKIDKIITETIDRFINEKFNSRTLSDLWKNTTRDILAVHRTNNLSSQQWLDDYGIPGIPNGLPSAWWLDKVTDDMILTVGTKNDLLRKGFKFEPDSNRLYDINGSRCYAIGMRNGTIIVLKNDPSTLDKIKQLSNDAMANNNERESNKRYVKNDSYKWSTYDRGSAFHDWKTTQPLWDSEEFRNRRDVNVPKDWRSHDTWLKRNMDKAIASYGKKKNG